MLLNYFRIAFRNIKKDKLFTAINIAGLAVGITCFITLALFILDELSFDKFNKNANNTYRVFVKTAINGNEDINSKTSGSLGPVLTQNFPEILTYTRIGYFGPRALKYKEETFRTGDIYAVDSTFFAVFTLPFIEGDPKTALKQPNSLVLTETAAKRFFGNENPVGKTLNAGDGKDFLITGLMKDFPKNSHFSCQMLESMSTYEVNKRWTQLWFTTYVVLKDGADIKAFEKKMERIVIDYVGPEVETLLGVPIRQFLKTDNQYSFHLQPLTSIYLHSQRDYGIDLNTEWGGERSSDIAYIYIFSAVAIFILLIAIINFMNLATARSERRSKEVGIRKTLGSNKLKLIWQFIIEAVLMSLLAVIVSLALVEICLPLFNNLTGKELTMGLTNNLYTIPLLIVFILFVGMLAGSYPAFYLSSFQPVQVLKTTRSSRKSYLRSTLVIIQFAISITLLIGTLVIKDQLNFLLNKNLGFRKDHLVSIYNASVLGSGMETFKQELLKNPKVVSVTSSSRMFSSGIPGSGYLYNKKSGTDPMLCQMLEVDFDFLKTFKIGLSAGRFFSKEFSTDSLAVVVNEAAVKIFKGKDHFAGAPDILGKGLTSLDPKDLGVSYKIIGIIKDFNYESLHQNVRPLVIHFRKVRQFANILTLRISPDDLKSTVANIETTWKNFAPTGEGMYYSFVDEALARLYDSEERTETIASVFSGLAIFIACLGLFGLAAFVTEQRTKEVGIRKVLGASIFEIVALLSKEFTKWVVLANIIAWPVAYYMMRNWLTNFAYKINLNLTVFIISGAGALIIALITVGFHAVKAAKANPVESLKYE